MEPEAKRKRVLFVCVGNTCRSQMAEALARHLAAEVIEPSSAGISPFGRIVDTTRRVLLEPVLFQSGGPILLTPGGPAAERRWERVLIGWNAKPEAMRAVTAALPLLQAAKEVFVATVDAKPSHEGHGEAPGRELAQHLAHRNVRVEVRNLDSLGRSHTQALLDEASTVGAEVLVLGAYGHSRAQEFLFGGVTRDLLAHAPLPLLLAH